VARGRRDRGDRRVELRRQLGSQFPVPLARHGSRHAPGRVREMRPFMRRARTEHLPLERQGRPLQALHSRPLEVVGDQPAVGVEIGIPLWNVFGCGAGSVAGSTTASRKARVVLSASVR